MRLTEFASAEEQLALWKLVSDNVWSAIATQAEQERRDKAEKAARSKPKRGKRHSSPKAAKPVPPKPPAPAQPKADRGFPTLNGSNHMIAFPVQRSHQYKFDSDNDSRLLISIEQGSRLHVEHPRTPQSFDA